MMPIFVKAFEKFEEAWGGKKTSLLRLNHLAGFRLAVYKKRGWDSVLKEPLFEIA